MFDFVTLQADQPRWRWYVVAPASAPAGHPNAYAHTGTWHSPTPEAVANWLGWQLTDQERPDWQVRVYPDGQYNAHAAVVYDAAKHMEWVKATPAADPVMRAISRAVYELDERAELQEDGSELFATPMAGLPDPATAEVTYAANSAITCGHVRVLVDKLLASDELADPAGAHGLLADLGDVMIATMSAVAQHAIACHPGASWTECASAAELLKTVCHAYATIYAATGR